MHDIRQSLCFPRCLKFVIIDHKPHQSSGPLMHGKTFSHSSFDFTITPKLKSSKTRTWREEIYQLFWNADTQVLLSLVIISYKSPSQKHHKRWHEPFKASILLNNRKTQPKLTAGKTAPSQCNHPRSVQPNKWTFLINKIMEAWRRENRSEVTCDSSLHRTEQ